jgi:hypothetical protein
VDEPAAAEEEAHCHGHDAGPSLEDEIGGNLNEEEKQ